MTKHIDDFLNIPHIEELEEKKEVVLQQPTALPGRARAGELLRFMGVDDPYEAL